jgi:FOG: CBS domain
MNILFFLTPKSEVAYIYDDDTLWQALEKMECHRYTAVPIIDHEDGTYIGTLTEGDLLWDVRERYDLNLQEAEDIPILAVNRRRDNEPVAADANIEDLISKVMNQNFVPVIDDEERFIGIITRKDVIQYLSCKCGMEEKVLYMTVD